MRRLAIDVLDRFIAVKFSCFYPSSRFYVRANLRYFSTSRFAQPTYLNQSFQVPVGNNGHVSLNVTYPSIAPTHGQPSVIIRLPPGPLFQQEAELDKDLPATRQTPDTSLNSGIQDGPCSEALASVTSSTVVTINYRLGATATPSPDLASESALCEDEERRLPAVKKQVFYRYPTPVHDTLAGFDWVQQNLQPARLGIIGAHIGGSLALMLALTEAQSVHAVAALEPICDWAGLDEHCLLMEEHQAHEENAASKKKRGAGSRVPAAQDLVPLLEARKKFFATPERYFDAFASPVLFLRSAGKDVPRTFPKYRTGPDYPVPVLVSNQLDRQPISVWDGDTQDQGIHQQCDIYDSSETDLLPDPDSKSISDSADASISIQGRAIRRRKALSRWPPYGLDYGSSASPRYHIHNQGIKRLEMALPNMRLFVRAQENENQTENEQSGPVPASDGKRNPRKTQRRSVLAQQADEMVVVMRRACFWGREKGYGESRVTLAQVAPGRWPVSGEEDAGRWLGEILFSKGSDAS